MESGKENLTRGPARMLRLREHTTKEIISDDKKCTECSQLARRGLRLRRTRKNRQSVEDKRAEKVKRGGLVERSIFIARLGNTTKAVLQQPNSIASLSLSLDVDAFPGFNRISLCRPNIRSRSPPSCVPPRLSSRLPLDPTQSPSRYVVQNFSEPHRGNFFVTPQRHLNYLSATGWPLFLHPAHDR
ncbi:hypothetical protein BDR06DRAFT_10170 [Suillus hirtellus]|nr:hypothetical protein BDR06DRAFT_10170 [Suillus hirtellus]